VDVEAMEAIKDKEIEQKQKMAKLIEQHFPE